MGIPLPARPCVAGPLLAGALALLAGCGGTSRGTSAQSPLAAPAPEARGPGPLDAAPPDPTPASGPGEIADSCPVVHFLERVPADPRSAASDPSRCLPVLNRGCGCLGGCGSGRRRSDGSYLVEFGRPIVAELSRYCAAGACVDVFVTEEQDCFLSGCCDPAEVSGRCVDEAGRCR